MAVLKIKQKDYMTGDAVTAKIINDVIDTAIAAHQIASDISSDLQLAKENSVVALAKATNIETRAINGDFNAVLVEANGMFGFMIAEGNLVLSYSGNEQPNLVIDSLTGNLVLNI